MAFEGAIAASGTTRLGKPLAVGLSLIALKFKPEVIELLDHARCTMIKFQGYYYIIVYSMRILRDGLLS